jgi:DNA-binding response OmpR family regulator
MNRRRIFLVDDDVELRKTLLDQLSHYREFDLEEAGSAGEALSKVRESNIDLMLLDVGLPDMDGREAVKILRREGFKSPIVMLTGQDSDADEILGLESGANDYVTKPFRFSVLLARIRAALRQHDQSEDVVFTIGPYRFQPAQKVLESSDGSTKIRLTDKETSILKYLYRQGPKTISRDVLLKEVWGYNNRVTTHTLETHIYRLRQKIERDPSNARLLVTEEGGYRLVP